MAMADGPNGLEKLQQFLVWQHGPQLTLNGS